MIKNTLLFSALLTLAFAGCGDDDEPGGNTPDAGGGMMTPDAGAPAEPLGAANKPALGTQVDRIGRPAITTATVATFGADDDAKNTRKDEYNAAFPPTEWGAFAADIGASLGILDALDGTCGNQFAFGAIGAGYTGLAGVLADDQLVVDSTQGTCGVYLGVEAGLLVDLPDNCGGRTPSDDVIDRSYSVLANGSLGDVGDGIDPDDVAVEPLDAFPYLAPPAM